MAKKILIIEDESLLSMALEVKLSNAGFEVKTVPNAMEATNELENDSYDLILMDVVMPQVDGFALLKELGQKKTKTPVIIVSNLREESDIERAKKLGAKDYFIKSRMSLSEIVERTRKFFEKSDKK